MKKGTLVTSRQNSAASGRISDSLGTVDRGRTNAGRSWISDKTLKIKITINQCLGRKIQTLWPSYVKFCRALNASEHCSSEWKARIAFLWPDLENREMSFGWVGRDFLKWTCLTLAGRPLRRIYFVIPRRSSFDFGGARVLLRLLIGSIFLFDGFIFVTAWISKKKRFKNHQTEQIVQVN